jgi:hypothetical protein
VQCFKSEFIIVDHFAAAVAGLSIFFVLPKVESRSTYVQNRINRTVENVDAYKTIIGESFFDSVILKSFGKGVIKYVGSNSIADFREFPADMLIVDEYDECNMDNIAYASDRLRGSPYQFSRLIANPSIVDGGISQLYKDSSQKAWHVPCYACGKYSEVDWFKTVVREVRDGGNNIIDYALRDTEWEPGMRRDIYLICPHCNGAMLRHSKKGKWVPKVPDHPIEGYHLSMLTSLLNRVSDMYRRFKVAQHDPSALQHFYSSELGLTYATSDNKITLDLLRSCTQGGYNFEIQDSYASIPGDACVGPCSMGIDVGKSLDVRISRKLQNGKRLAVFIGKVFGQSNVLELIERYNVQAVVMDAGPELAFARETQEIVQNELGLEMWLCRFKGNDGTPGNITHNEVSRTISIDRTEGLDKVLSELRRKRTILPENFEAIYQGGYKAEMCTLNRIAEEDAKGRKKYRWVGKDADHSMFADLYDILASSFIDSTPIEAIVG